MKFYINLAKYLKFFLPAKVNDDGIFFLIMVWKSETGQYERLWMNLSAKIRHSISELKISLKKCCLVEMHFVLGSPVEVLVLRDVCLGISPGIKTEKACGHRLGVTIGSTYSDHKYRYPSIHIAYMTKMNLLLKHM